MILYSIGQVSAILAMPVKTIRYYDEIGLCSPSETDKDSGYRYYSIDDIMRLDMIRCLGRALGMPLRMIGEYLDNDAKASLLKEYLHQQEREIDTEIERLLDRRALLNEKLDAIIRREMTSLLVPTLIHLPERKIYTAPQSAASHEQALFAIREMVSASPDVDKRKLYLLKSGLEDGGPQFLWKEFRAGTDYPCSEPGVEALTLESGLYAVITYRNSPEDRAQAFCIFRDFVAKNGYAPDGPLVFEYALLDVTTITMGDMRIQMQVRLRSPDRGKLPG